PGAPYTNVLCLVFLAGILLVMWFTPGIRTAILLIPGWLLLLTAMYWLRRRQGGGRSTAAAPQG
ncbi:MAG: aromatic amino acid transporter AroP, partial [Gammaproteobacteria bacterium]|nr:aromatic amino acid transporter AroP [Gammaproteobacteria bacterium]